MCSPTSSCPTAPCSPLPSVTRPTRPSWRTISELGDWKVQKYGPHILATLNAQILSPRAINRVLRPVPAGSIVHSNQSCRLCQPSRKRTGTLPPILWFTIGETTSTEVLQRRLSMSQLQTYRRPAVFRTVVATLLLFELGCRLQQRTTDTRPCSTSHDQRLGDLECTTVHTGSGIIGCDRRCDADAAAYCRACCDAGFSICPAAGS